MTTPSFQVGLARALSVEQRRAAELALVAEVGAALARASTPGETAQAFLRCIRRAIADRLTTAVLLRDETMVSLRSIAADGPGAGELDGLDVPIASLPDDVRIRLVEQQQPLVLADTAAAEGWEAIGARVSALATARCFGALPLIAGDRLVGVLIFRDDETRALDLERVHLVSILGQYLAGALRGGLAAAEALDRQRRVEEELERVSRARRHVASIVSHDLRTPLTAIRGFSEMIRDEDFGVEEIKEFAGSINKGAKRLNSLISDLLDLDRLDSGRITLNLGAVDLNAIITGVADQARTRVSSHRITTQLDAGLPPLTADQDRLTQVLDNLLTNAIEYSPDGGEILITSRVDGDAAAVAVQDHGIGIAPEALDKVFDRYARLDPTTKRCIRGIGLGLPIVRHVVQMHGGKIWVESSPGQGSTFHFTIPLDAKA